MRRPEIASMQKRNRARLRLKKGSGRQIQGHRRRERSARFLVACSEAGATAEVAAREPTRCGFGAVRVGALLMRLRLHLQTERFLAVHRGDAVWEAGCMAAALALADVVAGMREAELGALLQSPGTQERRALRDPAAALPEGEPARCSAGLQPCMSADSDENHAALKGSATSFRAGSSSIGGRSGARQLSDACAGLERGAR